MVLLSILLVTGCSGGAVVFAPTPLPPDVSPLRYEHPSGAFSVTVPRHWPLFTQNATTLAAASFAAPHSDQPTLKFAVANLGDPVDGTDLGSFINQYQQTIRPDLGRYKEENRQAMGDGSWRISGLRIAPGGATQQINTFIERAGSLIGIAEVIVPENPDRQAELQGIINTFQLNPTHTLDVTDLSVMVALATSQLDLLNIKTWTTPSGVFYITGEVANHGTMPAVDLPVRAILRTADGLAVAEAADTPMGYAILPGGFAPFSLRFGQGQPGLTSRYELILGADDWQPDLDTIVYGPDDLEWIDESTFNEADELVISGVMTNIGNLLVRNPRVVVTVFNDQQQVIAARFIDVEGTDLEPNESAPFEIIITEIGGEPAQYLVNIQGQP